MLLLGTDRVHANHLYRDIQLAHRNAESYLTKLERAILEILIPFPGAFVIENAHILCMLLAHMMTSSINGLNVPFFVSLHNFTCERPGLTAVSAVGDRDRDRDILLAFSCQHHA